MPAARRRSSKPSRRRIPEYTVLPDPYELLDGADDYLDAGLFFTQLRLAAARLDDADADAIAERGPLDFLAYLVALETLGRPNSLVGAHRRRDGTGHEGDGGADLLVVLRCRRATTAAGLDEDLELREAMNDALLELIDDPELTGDARVVEMGAAPRAGWRNWKLRSTEPLSSPLLAHIAVVAHFAGLADDAEHREHDVEHPQPPGLVDGGGDAADRELADVELAEQEHQTADNRRGTTEGAG